MVDSKQCRSSSGLLAYRRSPFIASLTRHMPALTWLSKCDEHNRTRFAEHQRSKVGCMRLLAALVLQRSSTSHAEQRSANMSVGRLVLAAGMVGIIEASTTNKPSIPYTCPRELTTAIASGTGPMRHVPTGWKYVDASDRIAASNSLDVFDVSGFGNSC
jgi:hypothetical protein